jgi:Ca2+-binding RTX toxin-like protein
MHPLNPLLAAAALVAATVATLPAAGAAGETCQGVPATIVGSAVQRDLRGTEGPDVIVTNDSTFVHALGGDDLVCVTGSNWSAQIDAGGGDDVVDTTGARSGSSTVLGAGADRFTGSRSPESVTAGAAPSVDTEADVIATAGIYDDVVTSGQPGVPNPDRIALTRGTLTWRGTPTPTSLLDGGRYSRLSLELDAPGQAVLDNRAGTLTRTGGPTLAFTGFTQFVVTTADGTGPFQFIGTDVSETLELTAWRFLEHRVEMNGGSDRLRVVADHELHDLTAYDGGTGARDRLTLTMPSQEVVDLDLGRGRLTTGRDERERTTSARAFESADVMAERVHLVGTARRNSLVVDACSARVEGLGDADGIAYHRQDTDAALSCARRRATFVGGAGRDVLVGTRGPDRLLGGRGHDEAYGRGGRDACDAERRHGCEVRL